jgi:hypothetical protein
VASVDKQNAVAFASFAHASTSGTERCPDVFGVAAHRAVVEVESFALELEGETVKRHSPSKLSS